MADFDYREDHQDEGLELVVRPGRQYGKAHGGQTVLIDAAEWLRAPTRDTLYSPEAHRLAALEEAQRREALAAPRPNQIRDGIKAQLDRLFTDAKLRGQAEEAAQE